MQYTEEKLFSNLSSRQIKARQNFQLNRVRRAPINFMLNKSIKILNNPMNNNNSKDMQSPQRSSSFAKKSSQCTSFYSFSNKNNMQQFQQQQTTFQKNGKLNLKLQCIGMREQGINNTSYKELNIKQTELNNDLNQLMNETDLANIKPIKGKQSRRKPESAQVVINLIDCNYQVIRDVAKELKWRESYNFQEEWDILWTDYQISADMLSQIKQFQKVNHFPGMHALSRKNQLSRNLNRMKKQFPKDYNFFPETWNLPSESNNFKMEFSHSHQLGAKAKKPIFIIKPENSSQGRGILISTNLEQIYQIKEHVVVQKYIQNPLLLDGFKFDLRIYVLITGSDPLRIFLFKEGLARLATEKYQVPAKSNLQEKYMHLTNYAINKDNPDFITNKHIDQGHIGHKRSLTAVLKTLKDKGHNTKNLMDKIKILIIKTLCCVQPQLSHVYKACQSQNIANNMCFEILGFDILLDSKLKPWLLEINSMPSFTTDSPIDMKIKKELISDTFNLLNINSSNRFKAKQSSKEQFQRRLLHGYSLNKLFTLYEKEEMIAKVTQERSEFESKNLGNFEKLYPFPIDSQNLFYESLSYFALSSWFCHQTNLNYLIE